MNRNIRIRNNSKFRTVAAFAFFIAATTSTAANADLLTNGNFETVGPNGPQTIHNGISSLGWSAAELWGVFHNTNGSTETNWGTYDHFDLPVIDGSQDPFNDHILRLEISHAGNGVVQTWAPLGTGPAHGTGSVWVYVQGPGQVGAGIGNGGNTIMTDFSQHINQWEQLNFTDGTSPVNEFLVYSQSGGVEVYLDFARASAVPEPASAGLGILGLVALARFRRRR